MTPALVVLQQAAGALSGVIDEIKRLPDAVRPFVDAFNPQAGENLDRAFRSLYSTIGFSLEPVIQATTRIVDGFAGAISEGMDRLRKPIEAVAGAFSGALRPALDAVYHVMNDAAAAVEELMPFLEPLGTALEGFASWVEAVAVIAGGALLEAIKGLVPGAESLQNVTDWLSDAFIGLIDVTVRASDALLSMVGRTDVLVAALEQMQKGGRPSAGRNAPPTNYAIGGLEDLYRRRLLEAARGNAQGIQERTFDVNKRMQELLSNILEEIKKRPDATPAEQAQNLKDLANLPLNPIDVLWRRLMGDQRQNARNQP